MNKALITDDIDFFGDELSGSYIVMVNGNLRVSWSWLDLWGWFEAFALKGGNTSAPTSCRDWFIPVPWNVEFMQPWFCVAKYEMDYENMTPDTSILNWINYYSPSACCGVLD